MDFAHLIFLFLAIGVIAFLYSSVGHAGASGYIAVMTLFGLSTATIRPTALVLNILVALIGSFQFWRAGHFSWKLFWPFAFLSVPAAYSGSSIYSFRRRDRRRRDWFVFGKPQVSGSHRFDLARDRPCHRRLQINFYALTPLEHGVSSLCNMLVFRLASA